MIKRDHTAKDASREDPMDRNIVCVLLKVVFRFRESFGPIKRPGAVKIIGGIRDPAERSWTIVRVKDGNFIRTVGYPT